MKVIKIFVTVMIGLSFALIANEYIGLQHQYSLLIALLVSASFGETFEVYPKGEETETFTGTFNVSEENNDNGDNGEIRFP